MEETVLSINPYLNNASATCCDSDTNRLPIHAKSAER